MQWKELLNIDKKLTNDVMNNFTIFKLSPGLFVGCVVLVWPPFSLQIDSGFERLFDGYTQHLGVDFEPLDAFIFGDFLHLCRAVFLIQNLDAFFAGNAVGWVRILATKFSAKAPTAMGCYPELGPGWGYLISATPTVPSMKTHRQMSLFDTVYPLKTYFLSLRR